jgi:hypothetical protein
LLQWIEERTFSKCTFQLKPDQAMPLEQYGNPWTTVCPSWPGMGKLTFARETSTPQAPEA